jgi:hypothetical protein
MFKKKFLCLRSYSLQKILDLIQLDSIWVLIITTKKRCPFKQYETTWVLQLPKWLYRSSKTIVYDLVQVPWRKHFYSFFQQSSSSIAKTLMTFIQARSLLRKWFECKSIHWKHSSLIIPPYLFHWKGHDIRDG